MNEPSARTRAGKALGWATLLVWTAAMFWSMSVRDLWSPDEPRYAEAAREMVVTGDWTIPHLNGRMYANKPPLMFWLIATCIRLAGRASNLVVRIPSFFAGLALVGLAGGMARVLAGRLAARLAAVMMLTSYAALWFLTRLNMDTVFACGVAGSIFSFYAGAAGLANRRWSYPFAWTLMALTTLTKGPAAIVMIAAAVAAVLWTRGQWSELRRMASPAGVAVFLLLCGGWMAAAARRGGKDFMTVLILHQNIAKAVKSHSHRHSIVYYFYSLPAVLMPWTLLLPASLAFGWRRARRDKRSSHAFLIVVSAALFVLLSLGSSKRMNYLMSLLPFLVVLIGDYLARRWRNAEESRLIRYLAAATLAALALAAAGGVVAAWLLPSEFAPLALAGGGVVGAAGAALAAARRRFGPRALFAAWAALMLAAALFANAVVFPLVLNVRKTIRPLAEYLIKVKTAAPAARLGIYRFSQPGAINFYSGHTLESFRNLEAAAAFLAAEGPRMCIVERKRLNELLRACRQPMSIVFEKQKGRKMMICVANPAAAKIAARLGVPPPGAEALQRSP